MQKTSCLPMMMSTMRIEMRLDKLRIWLSKAESEVLIISPYLTPDTLSKALSEISPEVNVTVICSWRTDDLLFGSSKLETYDLCQENGWSLRVDHDGMSRTIHLKAYVVDYQMAMIGSANMTGRGMRENIESLIPAPIEAHPTLADAIEESIAGSIPVDNEVYRQFREHISSIPKPEEPEIPLLTVVHGAMELEILQQMPSQPNIDDLLQLPSIRKALPVRGLRFGEIRRILRRNATRGSANNTINDRTMELMNRIVESDSRFDIQKRYGTDCLVWKVHHIINEEIRRHLKPHIGKSFRELGLEEAYWENSIQGSGTKRLRECSLNLLPNPLTAAILRLTTYPATINMMSNGKARYPKPVGAPVVLTDEAGDLLDSPLEKLLARDRILDETWFPSFCLFEPINKKLGDCVLRGFGFWECDRITRAEIEREIDEDIETMKGVEDPFTDDHPFRREKDSYAIFTKIASYKDRDKYPLGHPKRTMKRYLTKRLMTSILDNILGHDH